MSRGITRGALELGALGVVFGDIGTSPLYTVQTVFSPSDPHHVQVSTEHVYGVISLIFWAVVVVVMVTYMLLVMHADNDGEGGIMALITLIRRRGAPSRRRTALVLAALGVFGASLFFGDSMITPAISVLSAIEGVQVAAPSVGTIVLPVTAVILIGLFMLAAARHERGRAAVRAGDGRLVRRDRRLGHPRRRSATRRSSRRCPPPTPSRSCSGTSARRSSRWRRWCSR